MSNPPLNASFVRERYTQFEAFSDAVQAWNLDFRQLGATSGPFLLEQVVTEHMIYARAVLGAPFHQQGGSPQGYRTFSILASGAADFRWSGELITSDCMLVMPENGDFESVSSAGLDSYHLSLSIDLMQWAAMHQLGMPLGAVLGPERVFCRGAGEQIAQLRNLLGKYSARLADRKASDAEYERQLERFGQQLAASIIDILAVTERVSPSRNVGRRRQALNRALRHTRGNDLLRTSVSDLVQESGVSRRTLESAFQDDLGTSPAHYLKACRLNALRQALYSAPPKTTSVAALGRAYGFQHGGQLAADYLNLFGELPSATLRRSSSYTNRAHIDHTGFGAA